jgi:hypothetical protein
MLRCHLHLRRGDRPPEDLGIMDLSDIDAARAEATRIAWELRNELPAADVFDDTIVEVVDETGQTVLVVPLADPDGTMH